jgi:hypothetical protein
VSPEAVKLVMSLFFSRCESRPATPTTQPDQRGTATRKALTDLSALISDVECEEAGQEV